MSPKAKKILSVSLRSAICLGAMFWVLSSVSWYDYVILTDGSKVRMTNWLEVQADPRIDDPQDMQSVVVRLEESPHEISLGGLAKNDGGDPKFHIGLRSAWLSADLTTVFWAFVIFAPVPFLQSIRLTWMMHAQDIPLSYWEGMKLSYAGNFLNFVALGATGGDVYKAYYVSTHTHRKTEAVTTVFLDRAVGLVGLLLIAAIAMLAKSSDTQIRVWWPIIGGLCGLLLAGMFVAFSQRVRRILRIEKILSKLPYGSYLLRIDATTHRMRHRKARLLAALLMTILLQGLAIAAIATAGIGLGMKNEPELYAGYFGYLAMGLLVAAIPVAPQGLGTMDGALQIFFRGTYGNYAEILFMGFSYRLLTLIWSLPGILVPITGAHLPSREKIAQLQSLARPSES